MATIEKRGTENGKNTFRARIRLKGARDETASFSRLTDAKKWAQSTESAIREGRYFKTSASRRHTLGEAIDRYVCEIFPRKPRTASTQKIQLAWWRQRLGHLFLADVSASAIADARAELLSEPGDRVRSRKFPFLSATKTGTGSVNAKGANPATDEPSSLATSSKILGG